MKERKNIYVDLVLILVAMIWGMNPTIMKLGLQQMSPMGYNAFRMVLATVVCWAVFLISRTHRKMEKKDYGIWALGIAGFFLFQILFTVGVNLTTSGNASLTLALLPVSVAVINRFRKTEIITVQILAGAVISILGVVLIIFSSGREIDFGNGSVQGMLILLGAQVAFAVFTVYAKDLTGNYSNYQVITYVITVSGVLFVLFSLKELDGIPWRDITRSSWGSILFSGILAMSAANFLWAWGVKKLGSTRAALYNNLPPVFAMITGYCVLNETLGYMQLLGTLVIFSGLYLTRMQRNLSAFLGKEI